MKLISRLALLCCAAFSMLNLHAAVVGPAGYTNSFTTNQIPADFASRTFGTGAGDVYDLDVEANTNVTAAVVITQIVSDAGNPPTGNAQALWSSTGQYIATRPTGNRYTALMGKFVNGTGTNATQVGLSYAFAFAFSGTGSAAVEEANRGVRAYISTSGALNSWTNLATFNTTANTGSGTVATNIAVNWTNGGTLYILWIDDNANPGTDAAYEIDNFSLRVTSGLPLALFVNVTAPATNALFASSSSVNATAIVANGTSPYTVQFFTNSGVGNTTFSLAGTSTTAPYNASLGQLAAGTYNIYAVVTDSAGVPFSTNSLTNTFSVAAPITATLTAPANNATFDNNTSVSGAVTISRGTAPYSVQFYLDNVANGAPVTTSPYERNFGTLFVGDHTIRATVTDASGWVSNSSTATIHITGPLGVTITPTNGASFNYGQPITLDALPGGGTAPYSVTFFTNGQSVGTVSAPPFSTNVGLLAVGTHTIHVLAQDSSAPTAQQALSTTNTITILDNPVLAALTAPTNGQTAVAGIAFNVTGAASVLSPLTIVSVEFFYDGASLAVDSNAPYGATIANPSAGAHTVYARAVDSIGRAAYTATNQITFVVDPLANNDFANRIQLSTPASVSGNNTGATTQQGEPANQFGGGQFITWGATLWYKWVAPITGTAVVDTFGSSINTVLSVYTGTAVNQLTLVQNGRNDNAPGSVDASLVTFNTVAGTEYQIQVGGFGGGFGGGQPAQGPFQLHVSVPPAVSITSPANNSVFDLGTNVTITADAAAAVGTITKVEFYRRGGPLIGTVSNAPYSVVYSNAIAGTNSLVAVAFDSIGQVSTSAVVNVAFFPQGLTLVSPVDGNTYLTTAPIAVNAHAQLSSATMTNVEFFVDEVKFGEDATAPFSVTWSNVVGGSHRFTAIGRSDNGQIYESQPVNIAVAQSLVASNSVWKYLDNGTDQSNAWYATTYNDSAWAAGPAPLGYGDSGGRQPLTTNSFGPDANNKFVTTYYRQWFTPATNNYTNVVLNIQRDDGAIVYLNGAELARFNMPTGTVTYTTLTGTAADDGTTTFSINVPTSLLLAGSNLLAVELHQDLANSSDIWFGMEVFGIPPIIRNLSPTVALTNPIMNASFVAPSSITLRATASDADGFVTKVEFFAGNVKLGEATAEPHEYVWNSPPVGAHVLTAVATDNQNARRTSAQVPIVVYDAAGNPVAQVTAPPNNAVMEGPTNLTISAAAYALTSVTNVEFFVNGSSIGNDAGAPYSVVWPSVFYTSTVFAVASDINGARGTSAVISVVITVPPTNYDAPVVIGKTPTNGATVTNLTSINVRFSERVIGVDAGDLLINSTPATNMVMNSPSNYTFFFAQPPYGNVFIHWEETHGITDVGYPQNLPFNDDGPGANWNYTFIDVVPPAIIARTPAPGSLITNLTQVNVTFSEPVTGVNASDMFVNGSPAISVSGSGANYTFTVNQPNSGTVSFTWLGNNGILDAASNMLESASSSWTVTLDARTIFVQSNANWTFMKGTNEASTPTTLWRTRTFDDSTWQIGPAPFYYGDAYNSAGNPGTLLSDMQSNYTTVFLRSTFVVANPTPITNLILSAQVDDGFTAWINGFEVARFNVGSGEIAFNATATNTFPEPGGNGPFGFTNYTLPAPSNYLAAGTNVLTVQLVNDSLGGNDLGFNAQLFTYLPPLGVNPPRVTSYNPSGGTIFFLTNIVVRFNEPVTNVDAGDLRINGAAASSVTATSSTFYTFFFPQPPYGAVDVTWITNHGIVDFDSTPHAFDSSATFARYFLVNPSTPIVGSQSPAAGSTNTVLGSITVNWVEAVQGVNAADMLINGVPATNVIGGGASWTFQFAQPPYGPVAITWATNHGITDFDAPPAAFEPSLSGNTWSYTLKDPIPPIVLARGPYLQVGTPTSAVIRWRTDLESDTMVRWGTNLAAVTNVTYISNSVTEHIVQISNLQPSTRYYYTVGASYRTIGSGADFYFDTHPVPGTRRPVRIWALGDPGTGTQNQVNVRNAFYNYAATNGEPDLWLMLGDNAYNSGLDSEYQTAVFEMYPTTLRNKFLWPAIGNHETAQSFTATEFPYLDIFTLPQNGESGGVPSGNPKYYSFDYANIHFVCLDSMTSGRNQTNALGQWLQADLSSTTQEWIIAFWHHPPYTRGNHNSDSEAELIELRQNWLPLMDKYGVDLVLTGHSHAWERSYLLQGHYGLSGTITSSNKVDGGNGRLDGTGAYRKNAVGQGVVYIVAGSAGQITGGQLNHPANFLSLNELGSAVVDVVSNRLDVTFLATNGVARDRLTLLKAPIYPITLDRVTKVTGGDVQLTFNAYSNVTYTVLGSQASEGPWTPLQVINAAPTNRVMQLTTPGTNGMSFFRLRSP